LATTPSGSAYAPTGTTNCAFDSAASARARPGFYRVGQRALLGRELLERNQLEAARVCRFTWIFRIAHESLLICKS
jgi:hypothetical protein